MSGGSGISKSTTQAWKSASPRRLSVAGSAMSMACGPVWPQPSTSSPRCSAPPPTSGCLVSRCDRVRAMQGDAEGGYPAVQWVPSHRGTVRPGPDVVRVGDHLPEASRQAGVISAADTAAGSLRPDSRRRRNRMERLAAIWFQLRRVSYFESLGGWGGASWPAASGVRGIVAHAPDSAWVPSSRRSPGLSSAKSRAFQ